MRCYLCGSDVVRIGNGEPPNQLVDVVVYFECTVCQAWIEVYVPVQKENIPA